MTAERTMELLDTVACAYEKEKDPYTAQVAEAIRRGKDALERVEYAEKALETYRAAMRDLTGMDMIREDGEA